MSIDLYIDFLTSKLLIMWKNEKIGAAIELLLNWGSNEGTAPGIKKEFSFKIINYS